MTKKPHRIRMKLIRPLPDEHLKAIARVIINWSGLDVSVDLAISKILRVHDGAQAAVTIGIGLPYKLDMLEGLALTSLHTGPIRDELLEIIADIRRVQADRNFIAHAHWAKSSGRERVYGYLGRKNTQGYRAEQWTADQILKIASGIIEIESRLLTWATYRKPRRKHVPWRERLASPTPKNRRKASRE